MKLTKVVYPFLAVTGAVGVAACSAESRAPEDVKVTAAEGKVSPTEGACAMQHDECTLNWVPCYPGGPPECNTMTCTTVCDWWC
jgi:hypothetical protein